MYNAINALINIPWAPLGMPPLGVEGWLSALQEAQERDVAGGDNSFQEREPQACRVQAAGTACVWVRWEGLDLGRSVVQTRVCRPEAR